MTTPTSSYSTDNGLTSTGVHTNLSTTTNLYGQNYGYGITRISSSWVDLTANLPASNILLGFRYWTDTNTGRFSFMIDDINITGFPTDRAETDAGCTYKPTTGFHPTTGTETKWYNNYYVAEYRTYKGYDSTLKVGPYFFGYLNNPPLLNYVDHFPYQDSLLINYWDTSQANNQTLNPPRKGLLLPIDAHFTAFVSRRRLHLAQSHPDLQLNLHTGAHHTLLNLHVNSVLSPVPSLPGILGVSTIASCIMIPRIPREA